MYIIIQIYIYTCIHVYVYKNIVPMWRLVPDIPTAVRAKEALEGHCVYDGGFCKLRLSYSRHTDLNVKVRTGGSHRAQHQTPTPHPSPG